MRQFIVRVIHFSLIGIIPLTGLLVSYIYFDPFKVLKQYDDYSSVVIPNRDYVSTVMFIKNNRKNRYNSFIFGSSRTLAFRPHSWLEYLSDDDKPFMFDASAESIYGIYKKLKYLDSTNVPIKNALIIICRDVTFKNDKNQKGHLYIKHPATSGENSLTFQLEFFKAFLNPKFFLNYYSYRILGNYKPFMSGYIENKKITYDTLTNEPILLDQENEIIQNSAQYYERKKGVFYERVVEKIDPIQRITNKHLFMLKEVKRILIKNNTNYKIVLSPLYEQTKFNHSDLLTLQDEFGDRLYDFSGTNAFTENKVNYYETSHFRPSVGDSIIKFIYRPTQTH
jgi:hypothetical protein